MTGRCKSGAHHHGPLLINVVDFFSLFFRQMTRINGDISPPSEYFIGISFIKSETSGPTFPTCQWVFIRTIQEKTFLFSVVVEWLTELRFH